MNDKYLNFKEWVKVDEQAEVKIMLQPARKLELISRLSEKINKMLIEQAAFELESSQIYRQMACWLSNEGWPCATEYYMKSSDEEIDHYKDILNYIFYKNTPAKILAVPEPRANFGEIRDIIESTLEHEMVVTEKWNAIANTAMEERDNDTYVLAQRFLKEQQDEEDKFRFVLNKMNLDMPKYEIDALFKDLS